MRPALILACTGVALPLLPAQAADTAARRHRDGRWTESPAVATRLGLSVEDTALRSTSLMLLTQLSTGQGPLPCSPQEWTGACADWLLGQIDERGRIAFRTDRNWLRDHSLALFALVEVAAALDLPEVLVKSTPSIEALAGYFERERVRVDAETLFWTFLTCRRLEASRKEPGKSGARLRKALDRRLAGVLGALPREGRPPASTFYLRLYQPYTNTKELRGRADPTLDALLADGAARQALTPMELAIFSTVAYQLGRERWSNWSQWLAGQWPRWHLSTWFAAGAEGEVDFGGPGKGGVDSLDALAWRCLTAQVYFRTCRVSTVSTRPLRDRRKLQSR